MNEHEQRELLEELAEWTLYGYIEGVHDVEPNYIQAVEYMQRIDEIDGVSRPLPPLSDIMDYYQKRVQELQDKGQRGRNMISGGTYIEIDLLNDMLTNSPKPNIEY